MSGCTRRVMAIADELTEDGFVLRYRTDETDDGLSGKEGTFLICSFWLVSALSIVGEQQRAHDLMERLLRVASPLGLYAEEFDTEHRPPPGQLPAGVLASGADRGGRADHPRRAHRRALARWSDYDVIIIGTGAGGGTLAHQLAPSGKRILLLERGDWLPREPQNWLRRGRVRRRPLRRRRTRGYDGNGKAFQPQVHYYVGGATKLYGAALYRLRAEDFGELRHHDGISPAWPIAYEEMEPYYTQAEQLYQVHGARGEDPTEPPAQRALSVPGRLPRAAHPAARRRPRRHRPPPVPRALRGAARRVEHALQHVRALPGLRRVPVPRPRQVRRRGDRRAARDRAPQRDAADATPGGAPETNDAGTAVTEVVVERDGRAGDLRRRHRRRLLRRGQLGARCC